MSKSRIALKIFKNCKKKIGKITKKLENLQKSAIRGMEKMRNFGKFSKNVNFSEMVFCKYLENGKS